MFHFYGFLVGLSIVVGCSVAERLEAKVAKVLPWVLIGGLLGARLYHVLDLWEYYSIHWGQILSVWQGGLGIFGGIVGGLLGFLIGSRGQDMERRWRMLSAIMVGLPLSQAIGRWGNLVNDELWGRGHTPLFLYESILNLILFTWLWRLHRRGWQSRRLVSLYLVGYGVIRLMLEPLKEQAWWVGYVSASVMVVSGFMIWYKSHTLIKKYITHGGTL